MSQDQRQTPQQQINIELPPDKADGTYANLAIITHSAAEFVIDFTRILPGLPKAKVHSRIIMTPQHAKALSMALQDNVAKFESQHGEIKMQPDANQEKAFGFRTPGEEPDAD